MADAQTGKIKMEYKIFSKKRFFHNLKNLGVMAVLLPASAVAYAAKQDTTSVTGEGADTSGYERQVWVDDFINELVQQHNFNPEQLKTLLDKADKKQSILDAISRPAERRLQWKDYRKIFLTEKRIRGGVSFMRKYRTELERAELIYGVSKEVIVAIIGVETFYGRIKGSYRVVDALSTLGFDYPPRAEFFRKQLKEYLILAREEGIDPFSVKGSYAGAMGYPQFIPSSYRAFAVDFDGDKKRNIWNNPVDAIGSVANYFKEHGWQKNAEVVLKAKVEGEAYKDVVNVSLKPKHTVSELRAVGFSSQSKSKVSGDATAMQLEGVRGTEYWLGLKNFYVITRYNHSKLYAMAVHQLSQEIKKADQNG